MLYIPFTAENAEIATSYLSVEDADEIITKQVNSENWNGLTDEAKQILLVQSSFAVDGVMRYRGTKSSSTQLLEFPRNGETVIPINIKLAVSLTAMKVSNDDIFKNIKSETIAKHTTEYFEKVTIDDDVMIFLRALKATTIPVYGIEHA